MTRKDVESQFWLKSSCVVLMLSVLVTPAAHSQQMSPSDTNWAVGGHDIDNWRDQPNTSISASNVVNMKQKWVFTTDADVWATPAVVNNVVYFPDLAGNFYAVDATAGTLIWKHKVSEWTNIAQDYSRDDPAVYNGTLIFGDQGGAFAQWDGKQTSGPGARVIAVNATTGKPVWVTQIETFPSAVVTSSPVVYNNIVYVGVASGEESLATVQPGVKTYPCCTFRGSLVALNAQTGAKLWQVYTVPDNQGAVGGYSGGAIWGATPAIDVARNSIYVGVGNNYSVPTAATACIKANSNNIACTASNDYFDSVLAMDLRTGAIKWARRAMASDVWNEDCFKNQSGVGNCPAAEGRDYDFGGSGPNLITAHNGGYNLYNYFGQNDILGIGEKSGVYYALNPDNGSTVWSTQVGPGASLGGIEWGTATDGNLIYVPISNADSVPYALKPSGPTVNSGSWAALNPLSGSIVWQTPTPGLCSSAVANATRGCAAFGPASIAGGVVFAGSMDTDPANPTMFALSMMTGKVLWSFKSGRSAGSAPAIVGNSIYWPSGYTAPVVGGTLDNRVFAFSVN